MKDTASYEEIASFTNRYLVENNANIELSSKFADFLFDLKAAFDYMPGEQTEVLCTRLGRTSNRTTPKISAVVLDSNQRFSADHPNESAKPSNVMEAREKPEYARVFGCDDEDVSNGFDGIKTYAIDLAKVVGSINAKDELRKLNEFMERRTLTTSKLLVASGLTAEFAELLKSCIAKELDVWEQAEKAALERGLTDARVLRLSLRG